MTPHLIPIKLDSMLASIKAFNDMPLLAHSDGHSLVEMHFQSTGLKKMDTFSKSDPFARILLLDPVVSGSETEIGRTEVIQNTQSPQWARSVRVNYRFEETQRIRVEVWDEDKAGSANLADHDLQGACTFTIGELMSSRGASITKVVFA